MTYFFFWRKHLPKNGYSFNCVYFCADDSELSVESQGDETKQHLVRVLARSRSVLEVCSDWEQSVRGIHLLGVCNNVSAPMLIIQPPSYSQLNQYPLSFIFHVVLSSLWGGQVNISPDAGDCDAGDLDGESCFINSLRALIKTCCQSKWGVGGGVRGGWKFSL